MKYSIKCNHCDSQQTAYTLPLNASLVEAFVVFATKYMADRKGIKKGDIGLTNAQYSNFQNLRHFGLIMQMDKGQEWYLTKRGAQFYNGEIKIASPAAHLGGKTLPPNHDAWATHSAPRQLVSIRDVLPDYYKQREEYQNEKYPSLI